jgi:D-arabinose 1-dehydrogenase-like Zn-dependent alcohol dehydrogenase
LQKAWCRLCNQSFKGFVELIFSSLIVSQSKDLSEELGKIGIKEVDYIYNTAQPEHTIEQWPTILKPFGSVGLKSLMRLCHLTAY